MIRVGTDFVFVVKIAPDGWIQHHIVMDQTGKFIAEVCDLFVPPLSDVLCSA